MMTEMSELHLDIALATDGGYLPLAETALMSLADANPDIDLHIHLLDNGLDSMDVERIRGWLEARGIRFSVYPIDNLSGRLGIDVPSTISITSYARLLIASILPDSVHRVLYLDCDVLVGGSVAELAGYDLSDKWVAGVLDILPGESYKREISIPYDEPYLNAGVLLIPLDKWRELDMTGRFLDYLIAHKGNVHHHDQGIINAVCRGHKSILEPKYNLMSNYFSYGWKHIHRMMKGMYYDEATFKNSMRKPSIIHFTGADMGRPWTDDCHHPYRELFLKYYAKTQNPVIRKAPGSVLVNLEKWMFRNLPFRFFVAAINTINNLAYLKHRLR